MMSPVYRARAVQPGTAMTAHGDEVRCPTGAGPSSPTAAPSALRPGGADTPAPKQIYLRVTQPTRNSEEAICCVIGDILIPRRADGRHRVLPLPSDIQVRSRKHRLDNLTPILWFKIGNRTNEAGGGSSGYYGKPYQPGAIIKK